MTRPYCPRCEELEEDNRWLRRQLEVENGAASKAAIQVRFQVTPKEAAIIDFLHRRWPRAATKAAIMDAVYNQSPDAPEIKIIDVFVCKIRTRLGHGAIDTVWGMGYRLGDPLHVQLSETIGEYHFDEKRSGRGVGHEQA